MPGIASLMKASSWRGHSGEATTIVLLNEKMSLSNCLLNNCL